MIAALYFFCGKSLSFYSYNYIKIIIFFYLFSRWYIGTKLRPGSAMKMFPCFDGTVYKAMFSISIARSNSSQITVLSNTKIKSISKM